MKQTVFAVCVSLLILPACRKSNSNSGNNGILGSWKLIKVYDKSTATTIYPPAGSNKDIVITFQSGNSFNGNTLVNTFSDGTFTINGNQIAFVNFSMTKAGEDKLGESFLYVLHACSLQSITPCAPSEITIHGNKMKIAPVLRYDITLEKL